MGLIVGSIIRVKYTRSYRTITVTDDRKSILDMVLISLSGIGMFILPILFIFTSWFDIANYTLPKWAGLLGTFVYGFAIIILWKSHIDLGLNWSPKLQIHSEHKLVTSGIFAMIRHPMYAAHFISAIAQPLLLQNWIVGFSFLGTFIPGYLYRVKREEQMMCDHYGETYQKYTERAGRIIPKILNN
jgi:protein-S-isoprenylcysteine O-methyltransferase Ste14